MTQRARDNPSSSPPAACSTQPSDSHAVASAAQVLARGGDAHDVVLSADALQFVADLQPRFGARRQALLEQRRRVQRQLDGGRRPDFLPTTRHVRAGEWRVAPVPEELLDRRVEITGPVDRKMIINALNSGANVFMA